MQFVQKCGAVIKTFNVFNWSCKLQQKKEPNLCEQSQRVGALRNYLQTSRALSPLPMHSVVAHKSTVDNPLQPLLPMPSSTNILSQRGCVGNLVSQHLISCLHALETLQNVFFFSLPFLPSCLAAAVLASCFCAAFINGHTVLGEETLLVEKPLWKSAAPANIRKARARARSQRASLKSQRKEEKRREEKK